MIPCQIETSQDPLGPDIIITISISNDEILAYLLLGALLMLFLFLAVQLTQWYTASTANPQPNNNSFHIVLGNLRYIVCTITCQYYQNHDLKEWSDLYEKASFPDVNQMLSRTQVTLGPYYYLIMRASCVFILMISAYYVYHYNVQTIPDICQTRPDCEVQAHIEPVLKPSSTFMLKTSSSACYSRSLQNHCQLFF
ncbi:hypothetical protein DSO57_1016288 [Entomophthora muscae]|uniref:Uncharacterized protein n=1 Tax=Entomophthora muscae TaxID=34485 RepID=A0ACC2T5C3_9FUNG|nr:hypothetical protein DSO57_1016288 [Entomophthora muscae]